MSIRVLLADASDVMRPVIARVLREELLVELVGEASSFAEVLQLTAALKPDIVLLELHMPDESEFPAEIVSRQIRLQAACIIAISLWNDSEAQALAKNLGAVKLLDKSKLFSELIPTIKLFRPHFAFAATPDPFRTGSTQHASDPQEMIVHS